ncbi:unnamed protein product, partial [Mesorhabditis spiculigera]
MDPDVDMINAEAVKLIAKAAEFFIEELSRASYTEAVLDKRKTVQAKDIGKVIAANPVFEFLEDALDDWYEDMAEEDIVEAAQGDETQPPETLAEDEGILDEISPDLPETADPDQTIAEEENEEMEEA